MKDNKHIQKFNEHQENLNISDVMCSLPTNEFLSKHIYKTNALLKFG
jgi:hypothetical protein